MSNPSNEAATTNRQAVWDKLSSEIGLPRTNVDTGTPAGKATGFDRVRSRSWWLPALGSVSMVLRLAAIIGTVLVLGYKLGARHPAAATAAVPTDMSVGIPTRAIGTAVYRAPSSDSLRVAILQGSSAVLAPGAILTITPRSKASVAGAVADAATLVGAATFDIGPHSKHLSVRTIAGSATVDPGRSEVAVVGDTLVVRAFTANVFVRPGGTWSFKSVVVTPGKELHVPVGAFVTRHWLQPIGER